MPDQNILFQPVGQYCRREVATCRADDQLVEAALRMSDQGISSLVVCDNNRPVGIVTDRDLRNKVVAKGIDPCSLTVSSIMTSPLITIGEQEFLFEALHRISRHGIHRIVVVSPDCRLIGIITDSDILRLQTNSPQRLVRRIEEAQTIDSLRELHQEVQKLVVHLFGTGVRIHELVRLIAHLNDQIMLRLIRLLRKGTFSDLTGRFAFLVLGSEARGEQTLTTDQDNALIYADDLTPAELQRIIAFSDALIECVIKIGIPPCPGGIMANNAVWRLPLSGWKKTLDQWFDTPTPDHIMKVSMVSDLRMLTGDTGLEQELRTYIGGRLKGNDLYLGHMLNNLLRFKVPLSWLGKVKTERGEHRGQLDLKKAGIFSITEGIKLLALSVGIQAHSTLERINWLVEAKLMEPHDADDLTAAYHALVFFRLKSQIEAIQEGRTPDNRITHVQLNGLEQARLQSALEKVRSFQEYLQRQFRLGQII